MTNLATLPRVKDDAAVKRTTARLAGAAQDAAEIKQAIVDLAWLRTDDDALEVAAAASLEAGGTAEIEIPDDLNEEQRDRLRSRLKIARAAKKMAAREHKIAAKAAQRQAQAQWSPVLERKRTAWLDLQQQADDASGEYHAALKAAVRAGAKDRVVVGPSSMIAKGLRRRMAGKF